MLRCLASVDSRGWDVDEVGRSVSSPRTRATVAALAANEPMVVGDLDATRLGDSGGGGVPALGLSQHGLAAAGGRRSRHRPHRRVRHPVRDYTVHLDVIRNVGRLLAGSFEKAMLVERLEGGNRDLRLLVDSGMEFGATLDVDAVLRTVARSASSTSPGRRLCDVYRVDGDEIETLVAIGEEWVTDPSGAGSPLATTAPS